MDRAEAEDGDAVIAVVAPLLGDRQAAAHRLADADLQRRADLRIARLERPGGEPREDLGFGSLGCGGDRTIGQPRTSVQAALADAEVIDRDEDPAARGMPFLPARQRGPGRSIV